MNAIILTKYGPPEVLQLREVEKPVPKKNEVLVRVYATSVGFGDLLVRDFGSISPQRFHMPALFWVFAKFYFGFARPKIAILGSEFSGVVEAVGAEVKMFTPGESVFGYLGQRMGAYAEYLCIRDDDCIAHKPTTMSFEEAAVVPYGSVMALALLRSAAFGSGKKVLINGASGGIGSAAVQLAKHHGAKVTGVCGTPRLDFVRSLGADSVIDYTREDFTTRGEVYDLIVDVLGKTTFSRCKDSLASDGILLFVSFKLKALLQMLWTKLVGGKRVICAIAPGSKEDLESVRKLVDAKAFKTIIDKEFPLDQAAEAHRYAENGYKRGSVVIRVSGGKT